MPTGETATLPITDESVYPNMAGGYVDGYGFQVAPGLRGATWSDGLRRHEVREVHEDTTVIAFEWITSEFILRVHDQSNVDIPGSTLQISIPGPAGGGLVPTGEAATLPITDESVYPNMAGGYVDGYGFIIIPGIRGTDWFDRLTRHEVREVHEDTTVIAFEWIQHPCDLIVLDDGRPSRRRIDDLHGRWAVSRQRHHHLSHHQRVDCARRLPDYNHSRGHRANVRNYRVHHARFW